jgi:lysophospholipase L1-like esterase
VRARSRALNSLFLTGSVAIPLVLGEVACRLAGYRGLEAYRPDSDLGWMLEPDRRTVTRVGRHPVAIDGDGFRDAALAIPKPRHTVRVFALGASTTFGWGVRQEDVYHQVLEGMLNDAARVAGTATRYEIVNAGVIGYNQWQTARAMRRIADRFDPDGFLVAYTFNDAWNAFGTLSAGERDRVLAGVRRKNLLRRSALYNWIADVRARRLAARAGRGARDALAAAQTGDTTATPAQLAAYRAALDSMITLARDARHPLAFTVLAARGQPHPWPRQAAMVAAARGAGVPVGDLVPAFAGAHTDSLYLGGDAVHPSPRGHELIARLLYAELCAGAAAAAPGEPPTIYRAGCPAPREAENDRARP